MAGSPWPLPFKQGAPAVPNTLSDIATYYWARDLKPLVANEVPAHDSKAPPLVCSLAPCPPNPMVPATLPNDLDPTKDVAWWQHVKFSAISFGAEGTLDAGNQPATMAALTRRHARTGRTSPNPTTRSMPTGGAAGAVAVDDLWHATAQSRGTFVFARSPIEVAYGLASILAGIQNQTKSRAGVAFGGQVLNAVQQHHLRAQDRAGLVGGLAQGARSTRPPVNSVDRLVERQPPCWRTRSSP